MPTIKEQIEEAKKELVEKYAQTFEDCRTEILQAVKRGEIECDVSVAYGILCEDAFFVALRSSDLNELEWSKNSFVDSIHFSW